MKFCLVLLCVFFMSCTTARVAVPQKFADQASSYKVSGLNGWMVNQQLRFGDYITSPVKRGWDFAAVWQASRISFRLEDQLVKVFNISTDNRSNTEKNKLQFTIENGQSRAAVFALEKFQEKQLVYKSPDPRWGEVARTTGVQYAFSAAIVLLSEQQPEPWQLVLVHKENKRAEIEQTGYLSNGQTSFDIQPLTVKNYTNSKGKEVNIIGGGMFAGYEILVDGGIVGVVDVVDNQIWMINELDPAYKMVLAAAGSSLLLKRKQDIANL